MKRVRYSKYVPDPASEMSMEDLLGALSDYLLQSGFQDYMFYELPDGEHTMEQVKNEFEDQFKPHRLEYNDLEGFARQLITAGLVQSETSGTGKHLFQRRAKQRRLKRLAALSSILYWKIPVFDPDRIQDHATYDNPHRYATGVEHVAVNGTLVLRDGEHTGAKPGRVVRGPLWSGDPSSGVAGQR